MQYQEAFSAKFAVDLTNRGVAVDVYELNGMAGPVYFNGLKVEVIMIF